MQQNMERPRNSFETQHAAESESEDSTVSPQYLLALYQTVAQRRKTHKHLGALDTALFQLEKVVSEESEREKECPDKPSKVGGPHTTVLPSKTAGGINLIMSQFSYFDLPMENHHEPLGSAAQAALTGRAPLTFVAFAQLLFYFLNTLKACLRFLKNLKEDLRQKRPLCSGMQIWFATRGLNLFLRATDDEAVDMEPFFEEWKKRCPGPSSSPCSSKQTSTKPADKSLVSEPFRSSRPTGSGDNLLEISKSTEVVVDSTDVLAAPQQAVGQRQAPDSSAEGFTDSDDEDPEADLDRLAEEATSEHEDQKPEFARRRPFNERTSLERALWLLCDPLDSARQASKASANSIPSAALQHMDSITLIHTDHVRPFPRRFDFREAVRYAEGQQNSSFVGQLSEERLEAAILNLNPSFKPGGNQAKSTSLNGGGHCELCHSWSHDQDNKVSQASVRILVLSTLSTLLMLLFTSSEDIPSL